MLLAFMQLIFLTKRNLLNANFVDKWLLLLLLYLCTVDKTCIFEECWYQRTVNDFAKMDKTIKFFSYSYYSAKLTSYGSNPLKVN